MDRRLVYNSDGAATQHFDLASDLHICTTPYEAEAEAFKASPIALQHPHLVDKHTTEEVEAGQRSGPFNLNEFNGHLRTSLSARAERELGDRKFPLIRNRPKKDAEGVSVNDKINPDNAPTRLRSAWMVEQQASPTSCHYCTHQRIPISTLVTVADGLYPGNMSCLNGHMTCRNGPVTGMDVRMSGWTDDFPTRLGLAWKVQQYRIPLPMFVTAAHGLYVVVDGQFPDLCEFTPTVLGQYVMSGRTGELHERVLVWADLLPA
ncbi:hypothetical protein JB92DRAFT_2831630 [Gautieria morchelliformis]|nr:hypothetical protein JB92DRAFT_2831630 [Gautieria morchelliformis]